jgi:hypothetical protein
MNKPLLTFLLRILAVYLLVDHFTRWISSLPQFLYHRDLDVMVNTDEALAAIGWGIPLGIGFTILPPLLLWICSPKLSSWLVSTERESQFGSGLDQGTLVKVGVILLGFSLIPSALANVVNGLLGSLSDFLNFGFEHGRKLFFGGVVVPAIRVAIGIAVAFNAGKVVNLMKAKNILQ